MSTSITQAISRQLNGYWQAKWNITAVASTAALAFALRVVWQHSIVFAQDTVLYRGVDAWYHMRLADYTVANFPRLLHWDMYALHPGGVEVGYRPLLTWIVAGAGQGYEVLAAYLPAILGALTIIPVYFLGRTVFGHRTAVLGSILVAIVPGEFLHRTLLGFADHHALEVFLMLTIIALVTYAYRTGRIRYAIPAGVAIGLYCITWLGGLAIVFILGLWTVIETIRNLRHPSTHSKMLRAVAIPCAIAVPVTVLYWNTTLALGLLGLSAVNLSLWLLHRYVQRERLAVLTLAGVVLVSTAGILIAVPMARDMLFISGHAIIGFGSHIQEAVSLITEPQLLLAMFGLALPFTIFGLWKYPRNRWLFLVFAVAFIVAMLGQRRWGYYAGIPVMMLAAHGIVVMTQWFKPTVRTAMLVMVCIVVAVTLIGNTVAIARMPNNITADWYDAMTWLRDETDDPFPEKAYLSETDAISEYGILSWWDYGHWVIRVGQRSPVSSPTHEQHKTAPFWTATSIDEAETALCEKGWNIRYVVVDQDMVDHKWGAITMFYGDRSAPQESILFNLWYSTVEGYELVYQNDTVRIFERLQWQGNAHP